MTPPLPSTTAAAAAHFEVAKGVAKILTDFSIKTIIEDQSADDKITIINSNQQQQQYLEEGDEEEARSLASDREEQQLASNNSEFGNSIHEATHTQTAANRKYRAKNFHCPACKMAFSNNGQLKTHVRIHTGERPFRCNQPDCNKTFTRNEELTRHKLIHTGVRPHSCSACGKKFGRKDHLKKHARTHDRKRLRKEVFVPARACLEDIDMFVSPKPVRIIDSQDVDGVDGHNSDRPQGNTRLITNITSPSCSLPNDNNPASTTVTHHLPPMSSTETSAHTPDDLTMDNLMHCKPHHQAYHHAIPTLATSSAATTTTTLATTNNTATSAIQQLASDYWNKWYNLLGFYQSQYYQQPVDNIGGLFREG